MHCERAQEQLNAYWDGELPPRQGEDLERHLKICPSCQQSLARLWQLADLLQGAHAPPVPKGFADRVLARAPKERPRPSRNPVRWWLAASALERTAAAAVFLAGLALGTLMGWQTGPRPLPSEPQRSGPEDPVAVYNLDYLGSSPEGILAQGLLAACLGADPVRRLTMASVIKSLLILLSVVLNGAFVAAWVSSHHEAAPASHCNGGEPDSSNPLKRKLGVSDAQWRQIEPRLTEFRKSCQLQCGEINRLRRELIDLIAAPKPDSKAIAIKQREILEGHRKMQDLVVEQLLAAKAVLTPQQQKVLFNMIRTQCGCGDQAVEMDCDSETALNSGNGLLDLSGGCGNQSFSQRKSS